MKKLAILFLLFYQFAIAQNGMDNLWLTGYFCCSPNFGGNTIDFFNGSPVLASSSRSVNFGDQHAAISDSLGTLLFYTNGIFVYDAIDSLMQNSDTLGMNSCTAGYISIGGAISQGSIIVQDPNNSKNYYLINESCDYTSPAPYPKKLALTKIDMNLNGGLGAIVFQDSILSNQVLTWGFLTAVKHGNGRDWWVVTHSCTGNSFYTYLVTAQGIQGPFTQQIGFNLVLPYSGIGQTWFSPDGSKLATTTNTDINLFDFDRCTGLFSNWTFLAKPDTNNGGCVFASNSRFLYCSNGYDIYQYDLYIANWQNTETVVATYDGFFAGCGYTKFLYWTLMSNGKIYGIPAGCGSQYLHVISAPDSAGTACNVQQHSVFLPTFNAYTYPNYPNYRLGKLVGSVCDTLTGSPPAPKGGEMALRVFPNPATDKLNIETDLLFGDAEICIYNLLGEKCFTSKIKNAATKITLDVATLKQGLYLLQLKTKGKLWSKKFFKE